MESKFGWTGFSLILNSDSWVPSIALKYVLDSAGGRV
jgi:hypothetical protein